MSTYDRTAIDALNELIADADESSQRAPYMISYSEAALSPVVFASPHSGRYYPPALLSMAALDELTIRQSEDAFVDKLLQSAPQFGISVIAATFARAYLDVNREPYELDQSMFKETLPAYANTKSARVAAGLGSVAKVVGFGREIYNSKLSFSDAQSRILNIHHPYHRALKGLISSTKSKLGWALLIDWHSMPSHAGERFAGGGEPDIVLGDRFGSSCAAPLVDKIEESFRAMGYRVARNAPYAGGYTTELYGRPQDGVHAVQIELNRRLYMNERTVQPDTGFGNLVQDVNIFSEKLSSLADDLN